MVQNTLKWEMEVEIKHKPLHTDVHTYICKYYQKKTKCIRKINSQ